MKLFLSLLALIVAALLLPLLFPELGKPEGGNPERNLPWQIAVDGKGGSTVFGLQPGVSTLVDARRELGDDFDVAIVVAPQEAGTLEAFNNNVLLGFVTAKVVLTLATTPEQLNAMGERAPKAQYMESATKRVTLRDDDRQLAETLPIRAIAVIPSGRLDETVIVQRFGAPVERLPDGEKRVHLLYPDKGLDVIVDQEGRELLQYVAPRDFALLRAPLVAAPAAAGQ